MNATLPKTAPFTILPCDKCGVLVPQENSVLAYELRRGNLGVAISTGDYDRHFYPMKGEHPCEGSPSRVVQMSTAEYAGDGLD